MLDDFLKKELENIKNSGNSTELSDNLKKLACSYSDKFDNLDDIFNDKDFILHIINTSNIKEPKFKIEGIEYQPPKSVAINLINQQIKKLGEPINHNDSYKNL